MKERFYAISVEKRLKHPAVVAISEGARHDLFGGRRHERLEARSASIGPSPTSPSSSVGDPSMRTTW